MPIAVDKELRLINGGADGSINDYITSTTTNQFEHAYYDPLNFYNQRSAHSFRLKLITNAKPSLPVCFVGEIELRLRHI